MLNEHLYWYKAQFVRAIDGDTIEVNVDHGMRISSNQHLRLAGINAPEIFGVPKDSEEYQNGIKARDRLQYLCASSASIMIHTYKDKTTFNRYVADVYIVWNMGEKNVAEILMEEGLVTKA